MQLDYVAWEKVITDHGHIHALPLGIRSLEDVVAASGVSRLEAALVGGAGERAGAPSRG